MRNLLKKLGLKRIPILKETTLTDDDLVYLHSLPDELYLIKDGCVYGIEKKFSKINHSNPKVSLNYYGFPTKKDLEDFQPYKELRNSWKLQNFKC